MRDFTYTEIGQYDGARICERETDFSALLERFFTRRASAERVRQRTAALTRGIRNSRDRAARKIENQREELRATASREYLRESGDIITVNLHEMRRGQALLRAEDFYRGGEREIRLDPLKTPQENAARYFKEYTKAKNAETALTRQIESGERELEYLESVLAEIADAESERDIAEIRRELEETGYLKARRSERPPRGKKDKRRAPPEGAPREFVSASGFKIRVGRNNTQNDALVRASFKTDIWLHVQKRHGSHVVIAANGGTPDEATILQAAALAAYHSEAREDTRAAVDYCPVRHVKKPTGARPGMVIYSDYLTVYVAPRQTESPA
jgi:predicted ribosome quality control (RQC) complex YloA/Tae2 family protein